MTEEPHKFYKYHGCGNDFIIIDRTREASESEISDWLNEQKIREICTWHTGVGADGLIVLMPSQRFAFRMDYYNADGRLGSLCGNGSRCAVRCAHDLGIKPDADGLFRFEAHDGIHTAQCEGNSIAVSLLDFPVPEKSLHGWFVNNGSPHFLIHVHDTREVDVEGEGRIWRSHAQFAPGGTNVNFIEVVEHSCLKIRTFERGVERETMACGTGVTASAAWYASIYPEKKESARDYSICVETLGGELQVFFSMTNNSISSVQLIGPAVFVFEGFFIP